MSSQEEKSVCHPVDDRPLCPFCRNGAIDGQRYEQIIEQLGRGTIEAVLESIDPPYQEEEEEEEEDQPPPQLCPKCRQGVSDCATFGCSPGANDGKEVEAIRIDVLLDDQPVRRALDNIIAWDDASEEYNLEALDALPGLIEDARQARRGGQP